MRIFYEYNKVLTFNGYGYFSVFKVSCVRLDDHQDPQNALMKNKVCKSLSGRFSLGTYVHVCTFSTLIPSEYGLDDVELVTVYMYISSAN